MRISKFAKLLIIFAGCFGGSAMGLNFGGSTGIARGGEAVNGGIIFGPLGGIIGLLVALLILEILKNRA